MTKINHQKEKKWKLWQNRIHETEKTIPKTISAKNRKILAAYYTQTLKNSNFFQRHDKNYKWIIFGFNMEQNITEISFFIPAQLSEYHHVIYSSQLYCSILYEWAAPIFLYHFFFFHFSSPVSHPVASVTEECQCDHNFMHFTF